MYNGELLSYITEWNSWRFGHYNEGNKSTKKKGQFGSINLCLNKDGMANIFSVPKLEYMSFPITYYSKERQYIVNTKYGKLKFNKD